MQNYLVYRANTLDEIYECSYSLLRYLTVYNVKPPMDQRVVIYTSQPAMLENYGSFFHSFELKDVQELNTSRLSLIRNFFKEYDGNALYMDTNTYTVAPIEPVFADIANGIPYVFKWNQVMPRPSGAAKELKTILLDGKPTVFNPDELNKWNDSVMGLNSSMKNMLSDIIAISQQQTVHLSLSVVEKWIFHHHFQQTQLRTADHVIAQYDDLKEFRNILRKFFIKYQEESVPNQLKLVQHLDAAFIQQQKREFQQLPLHQKLIRRIRGKHWSIEKYKI